MSSKLLWTFMIAFLVFGVIGFLRGRAYVNDPAYLQHEAFRYVVVAEGKSEGEPRLHYELVYLHKGSVLYRYDIDTNKLSKTPEGAQLELTERLKPAMAFPIDQSVIWALLGGSTAGYTVKDLAKSEKSANAVKHVIAGILGAISGYTVGYNLGAAGSPTAESPEIRAILDDEQQWVRYEKTLIHEMAVKTFEMAHSINDEGKKESLKRSAALNSMQWKKKQDLTSSDFSYAAYLYNDAFQALASQLGVKTDASIQSLKDFDQAFSNEKDAPAWSTSWWIPSLVFLAGIIFIGTVYFISNRQVEEDAGQIKVEKDVEQTKVSLVIPNEEEIHKYGRQIGDR